MSAILNGKDLFLYVLKDDVFTPVVCLTSCSLNYTQEVKEATKPQQSRAKSFYAGMTSYDISADGLAYKHDDKASAFELMMMLRSGDAVRWMMKDETNDKYFFTGYVIPTSVSLTSPADGFNTFTFAAIGDGDISTNNPYHVNFILLDGEFGTEGQSFVTERVTDGDFPNYN